MVGRDSGRRLHQGPTLPRPGQSDQRRSPRRASWLALGSWSGRLRRASAHSAAPRVGLHRRRRNIGTGGRTKSARQAQGDDHAALHPAVRARGRVRGRCRGAMPALLLPAEGRSWRLGDSLLQGHLCGGLVLMRLTVQTKRTSASPSVQIACRSSTRPSSHRCVRLP